MWHHLYIDDPATAYSVSRQMQDEHFIHLAVAQDLDSAIFSRPGGTGGMHYYFTPLAAPIAEKHSATPCEKPSRQDAGGLLCGDQAIVSRLYD